MDMGGLVPAFAALADDMPLSLGTAAMLICSYACNVIVISDSLN